jgi:hypothetical protein
MIASNLKKSILGLYNQEIAFLNVIYKHSTEKGKRLIQIRINHLMECVRKFDEATTKMEKDGILDGSSKTSG